MPYTVYKVANFFAQEFYIGVHKTEDPEDNYMGSGKLIRQRIADWGPEHFTKEILFVFEKKRDAYQKEAELVNPLLGTPGCLNIHPGGHGGFGYINAKGLNPKANLTHRWTQDNPPSPQVKQRAGDSYRMRWASDLELRKRALSYMLRGAAMRVGQSHTEASRAVMSEKHKGSLNSQFGRCWVMLPATSESKRVHRSEIQDYTDHGWVLGRHIPTHWVESRNPRPVTWKQACPQCEAPYPIKSLSHPGGVCGACALGNRRTRAEALYSALGSYESVGLAMGVPVKTAWDLVNYRRRQQLRGLKASGTTSTRE